MIFSSTIFLFVFLPITLLGYYLINPRYRNIFLLIASIAFYAWGEPKYLSILIISIIINYAFALLVDKYRDNRKIAISLLTLMVIFNLSILFVFKYLMFVVQNVNTLFNTSFVLQSIALPIGISFFTFKAISYVVDVYHSKGKAQKNPLNVALYISFFPQLLAGPIIRYEEVENQINKRNENWNDLSEGMIRFIIGLAKKIILSNSFAMVADRSFGIADYNSLSIAFAWFGSICYTLQIFFDFSGYSDMAIGLGKMFGFNSSENFNYPYISSSISDFWRRWHISLSQWFRDYVYIPLGGSRVSKKRLILNLFVVWMLTGVWHGASWNFIFWGLFYFILLTFEKLLKLPDRFQNNIQRIAYRIFTLLCVNFGWVLFRANGIENAKQYILCMFGLNDNRWIDSQTVFIFNDHLILLIIGIIGCVPITKKFMTFFESRKLIGIYECIRLVILVTLLMISICYCVNGSYNPFIYFNF